MNGMESWCAAEPDEVLVDEVAVLVGEHGVPEVLGALLRVLDDTANDMGTVINDPEDAANSERLRAAIIAAIGGLP